jgi:hypothetical protein
VPGSGEGIKIGYISLGESIPFVKLVSDSIKEQARIAGAELVFCDSQLDASKALECGQNLKVQNVQGVLNFQAFAASAPEICAAYDGARPSRSTSSRSRASARSWARTTAARARSPAQPSARTSRRTISASTPRS